MQTQLHASTLYPMESLLPESLNLAQTILTSCRNLCLVAAGQEPRTVAFELAVKLNSLDLDTTRHRCHPGCCSWGASTEHLVTDKKVCSIRMMGMSNAYCSGTRACWPNAVARCCVVYTSREVLVATWNTLNSVSLLECIWTTVTPHTLLQSKSSGLRYI